MFRCLTIDPAVARLTRRWRVSGTFQAVLLIQPAAGTRPGFTAPFRVALSSTRGGIAAAGQSPVGAHAPEKKCALRGAQDRSFDVHVSCIRFSRPVFCNPTCTVDRFFGLK
jgi:hypothetical protein